MPLRFKHNFCKLHKVTLPLTTRYSVGCTISCHTCVLQLINTQLPQWLSCGLSPISNYSIFVFNIIYTQPSQGLVNLCAKIDAPLDAICKVETSISKDSSWKVTLSNDNYLLQIISLKFSPIATS